MKMLFFALAFPYSRNIILSPSEKKYERKSPASLYRKIIEMTPK